MTKRIDRQLFSIIATALTVAVASSPAAVAAPDPVAPADFVALADVAPSILQEMRYYTPHNFTGDPVDGYRSARSTISSPGPKTSPTNG